MFRTNNKVNFNPEDEEDDMYAGFNTKMGIDAQSLFENENIQQALRQTSYGRKGTSFNSSKFQSGKLQTGKLQTANRLATSFNNAAGDGKRLMTAVKAAGYSSNSRGGRSGFGDSFKDSGPAPPLENKPEDTPEDKIKLIEKKVNSLIDESCLAASKGNFSLALNKAEEAGKNERVLIRQRDQLGVADQMNLDLTYSVLFNLANQYAANKMYQEALHTYQTIVKNKMFTHAGRLKVNMGNIYFSLKNYSRAIKMYRMGLDQVPTTHKFMRIKIMQNIGLSFVKLGQYNDAIASFEHIMQEDPDPKTGLNLILCYYAKGDRVKMKSAFQKLLSADLKLDDEDRYLSHNDDKQYDLILEVIKNDDLKKVEQLKKTVAENCIKMAAKIIAPAIESNFSVGYDWCIDQVKMSLYHEVAHCLEIDKAIMYLKQKDFNQGSDGSLHLKAIETLKSFERKDTKVASAASTNLSFLYFLEGNLQQADKYGELALKNDRYNSAALVNKGNVLFQQKDYEKSREYYLEALQNDSSCVEALYNMGLSEKKMGRFEEALDCFFKLHAILRNNATVIYQIADVYMKLEEVPNQSLEWFMQLHGLIPTDSKLLQKLGEIYDEEGDKSQAFSVYVDSFKYYPSNLEVIEWLGAYYIESQFCEKAISYFERAALMQPSQVKWLLMIASCHRRSGNYQQALETYKSIHRKFPDNVECLQFLVRIYTDMGLPEAAEYLNRLKKAEKQKEIREKRLTTGLARRGSLLGSTGLRVSASRDNSASSGGSRENSAKQSRIARRNMQSNMQDMDAELLAMNDGASQNHMNITYSDPLGPEAERPKTAIRGRNIHDEFADEELDENMLPD